MFSEVIKVHNFFSRALNESIKMVIDAFSITDFNFEYIWKIPIFFAAKCADVGNASVYQEVVETMTGSDIWVTFVRVMIAIYAFSSCVAYLVLIGDQGKCVILNSISVSTQVEVQNV